MEKKYYIHDRVNQSGPYSISELEKMNLKSNTLIWYLGLPDWLTLDKVQELRHLIKEVVPPTLGVSKESEVQVYKLPINKHEASNYSNEQSAYKFDNYVDVSPTSSSNKSKSSNSSLLRIVLYSLVFICFLLILITYLTRDTYQEKIESLRNIENADPLSFLNTKGEYKENFWGDKIKISGTVSNSASVANYKDVVIRVTFYTKTQTQITEEDYIIYEFFPANSTKEFYLTVPNYTNTETIGWRIIDAKTY
jgi:hypothetical protein